jgi:flagellin
MSSIMTNSAAMTALQTLTTINKNMETTQNRISTGYRVATASDNAAYWSIATTMRSDNKALSAVDDALGLGAATVDVAYTAMESAIDVMDEIKAKVVAAGTPGIDRGKIQDEITELQNQLVSIADSASFNEENWLKADPATDNMTKSIVSSFSRGAAGAVSIDTTDVDITATILYDTATDTGILDTDRTVGATTIAVEDIDISALTDSAADLVTIEEYVGVIDAAVSAMTDAATNLGAVKNRVDLQQDFVSNLMDAIDRGIGQLVDADMNEESTRLQALQVQQQLGIQALSIANSNSQNILSLFR